MKIHGTVLINSIFFYSVPCHQLPSFSTSASLHMLFLSFTASLVPFYQLSSSPLYLFCCLIKTVLHHGLFYIFTNTVPSAEHALFPLTLGNIDSSFKTAFTSSVRTSRSQSFSRIPYAFGPRFLQQRSFQIVTSHLHLAKCFS